MYENNDLNDWALIVRFYLLIEYVGKVESLLSLWIEMKKVGNKI
jgi:hypothetical protein